MNLILAEILTNLEADIGSLITTYYQGEVLQTIPKSYLPALMAFGSSTSLIAKSTAKDQLLHEVVIRVEVDLKSYFDEAGTGTVLKMPEALIDFMEETDADGVLKATTVLGSLRKHIRGTNYLFNNEAQISYSVIQTGEFPYGRAELSITAVTDLKIRPS